MEPNRRSDDKADEEAPLIASLLAGQEAYQRQDQNPSATTWKCPDSSVPEPVEIAQHLAPRPLILQDPSPVFDKLDLDGEECRKFSRMARRLQETNMMAAAEDSRGPELVIEPRLVASTPMSMDLGAGIHGGNISFVQPQLATQQVHSLASAGSDPFQFHHPGQLQGADELHLGGGANVSSFGMDLPGISDVALELEPRFGTSQQASAQHGFGNLLSGVGEEKVDFSWEDLTHPFSGGGGGLTSKPMSGVAKQRSSRRMPESKQRVDFRRSIRHRSLGGGISADDVMGARLHEPTDPPGLSQELLLEQILEQVTAATAEETKNPDTKDAKDGDG
ncbi:hypothetical protein BSKO_01750 [Bryopsis sp. KO-2023]|nr:hypothetical protein BSKO_01750 [Bryopsis sp. KO-2023]